MKIGLGGLLRGGQAVYPRACGDGIRCFLPLSRGRIVTAALAGPNGQWVMDEQGARAFVSVWGQLAAANAEVEQLKAGGAGSSTPLSKAAADVG